VFEETFASKLAGVSESMCADNVRDIEMVVPASVTKIAYASTECRTERNCCFFPTPVLDWDRVLRMAVGIEVVLRVSVKHVLLRKLVAPKGYHR